MSPDFESYILNDTFLQREVDGELILLSTETGYFYSLNEVGKEILLGIQEKRTIEQILSKIQNSFVVSEEEAESDIYLLLEDLKAEGIIVNEK